MTHIVELNDPAELLRLAAAAVEFPVAQDSGGQFFSFARLAGSLLAALRPGRTTPRAGDRGGRRNAGHPAAGRAPRTNPAGHGPGADFPLADWGSFYGPIGSNPTATLIAGIGHVHRTPADWDLLDLRWLDRGLASRAERALAMKRLSYSTGLWCHSAQVEDSAGDWESYLAGRRRGRLRENLRAAERRFTAQRPRTIEALAASRNHLGRCRPALGLVRHLRAAGDQGAGKAARLPAPRCRTRACVRFCVTPTRPPRGPGPPTSACCTWGTSRSPLPTATSMPARASGCGADTTPTGHEGAGTVLFARQIEDSFARGDRILDFESEYLECKRNWTTRLVPSYHATHYRPGTVRPQALRSQAVADRSVLSPGRCGRLRADPRTVWGGREDVLFLLRGLRNRGTVPAGSRISSERRRPNRVLRCSVRCARDSSGGSRGRRACCGSRSGGCRPPAGDRKIE